MRSWSIRWDRGHGHTILLPRRGKEYSANLRLNGIVVQPVGDHNRTLPLPVRILQKGLKALAVQTFPFGQTAKIDERGINVDQADTGRIAERC